MLRINTLITSKFLVIFVLLELIVFSPSISVMPSYITLHDSQRLIALLLLALASIHSMLNRQDSGNLIPVNSKIRNAFFALLALASTSAVLAKSPRHAVIEISVFAGLCYLTLFVAGLYQKNKESFIKQLTYALWISILLYMFAFYVGYITACIFKTPLVWPRPFLGFNNIRFFNQYQLWSLGLIYLPLLAFDLRQNIRRGLYIALACWWTLLYYSASRGVILAWLVGMLITAIAYRKLAWSILRLQLTTMFGGLLGYYILFKLVPILLQTTLVTGTVLRESTSDRTVLWVSALNAAHYHPWFGIGPMNYPWYNATSFHPHNSVLQLAAEFGLPATLIILTIAGYGMYCWLKRFNVNKLTTEPKLNSNFSILLFFTLITNAAYSLVDGVIVMPISQVMMFTIIGLMIADYTYGQTVPINQIKRKITFRPIFAGIVLAAIIWSTLPEIKQGLSGYERGFSMGPDTVNPRLWIQRR